MNDKELLALAAKADMHLNNLKNATNILQSLINGTTSIQLAQIAVNAFNEYIDNTGEIEKTMP